MEARNIKVILTRSQQSVVIKSAATTLEGIKGRPWQGQYRL